MTEPTAPQLRAEPDAAERTTRRWAVAVLALATAVLVAYLAVVLVAVWFVGAAVEAVTARDLGPLDVPGALVGAVPGLVGGWLTGWAATVVLAGGRAMSPRAAGVTAGLLGVGVGASLLAVTGVL